MDISNAIAQATTRLYDSSDPVDLEAADVLANYEPNEAPVKEGDFIFYYQDTKPPTILVGKVIGIYPNSYGEVRTDSDGMQTPLGVSTRTDWVWGNGQYVLPRSTP